MAKFEHVVSLGYFCSVSLELDKVGLRNSSGPFDWLISDFKGVINCVDNNFEDFLNYDNLMQYESIPNYYYDSKYKMHFYHDFNDFEPLFRQLPSVTKKYVRRISRFYKHIKVPTLFVRYIENAEELLYIENKLTEIIGILKKSCDSNEILFISNDDLSSSKIKIFYVQKDENDIVARCFLDKNNELLNYMNSDIIDPALRNSNLLRMHKENGLIYKTTKYLNGFTFRTKRKFYRKYLHAKIHFEKKDILLLPLLKIHLMYKLLANA